MGDRDMQATSTGAVVGDHLQLDCAHNTTTLSHNKDPSSSFRRIDPRLVDTMANPAPALPNANGQRADPNWRMPANLVERELRGQKSALINAVVGANAQRCCFVLLSMEGDIALEPDLKKEINCGAALPANVKTVYYQ